MEAMGMSFISDNILQFSIWKQCLQNIAAFMWKPIYLFIKQIFK